MNILDKTQESNENLLELLNKINTINTSLIK